jgi:pyruvate dehydrogenase E1 component beta subunit
LTAADELAAHGIDAEVIDLRSLRPLDDDTVLASVGRTHRALVVDEG